MMDWAEEQKRFKRSHGMGASQLWQPGAPAMPQVYYSGNRSPATYTQAATAINPNQANA